METGTTISELKEEQALLQLATFNYDIVWRLGSALHERASQNSLPIAIQICHGNDSVFKVLLPGATIDNLDWARRKSASVHRFHKSTLLLRREAERDGYDFHTKFRLPPADYVIGGGGFPLLIKGGTYVGAIALSGLPDIDDHKLIVTTLRDILI